MLELGPKKMGGNMKKTIDSIMDINGDDVFVGDYVVYCSATYSTLQIGTVKNFTPKGVNILTNENGKNNINRAYNQIALIKK